MTHYCGDNREAFKDWADSVKDFCDPALRDSFVVIDEEDNTTMPLMDFLESFRGCTDIMPSSTCDSLDLPAGTPYGEAADDMIEFIERRARVVASK